MPQTTISERDVALLRRYEPIMRFSKGEQFYPMNAEAYIGAAQLCVLRPNDLPEVLVPRGQLTSERLGALAMQEQNAITYLHFVDPLTPAEVQRFWRESTLRDFHTGRSRLVRVGLLTRIGDVIFSLSLLLRGKVPGGQAAAAAQRYHALLAQDERYCYYSRIVRENGYIVLQYWMFYAYNDWRSSFHGVNDHEADWEMISVFLADEEQPYPLWLAYSAHQFGGHDIRRSWNDPEILKIDGHPVVFVAAGSHASYFLRGEYLPSVGIPLPAGIMRLRRAIIRFWRETLRQGEQLSSDFHDILRIPFVDYARGDGLVIGPGGQHSWEMILLQDTAEQPAPAWVDHYHGLWGLYTGDSLAGEDAPGGPRYQSDGMLRMSWNDPLGWSGLDTVPAPALALTTLTRHCERLRAERAELLARIDALAIQLGGLQLEYEALGELTATHERTLSVQHELKTMATELRQLKAQRADIDLALEHSLRYAARLAQGTQTDMRTHLRRPQLPASSADIRLSRAAEAWSAVSIGALLLALVVITQIRGFWITGVGLLLAIFAFLEALFHRRAAEFMRTIVVLLAIMASLVLIVNNLRLVLISIACIIGILVIIDNIRELRS